MNPNYFNRSLIESMKQNILKMISEDMVPPGNYTTSERPRNRDVTQQLIDRPIAPNRPEGGNLSMGRLSDAERSAGAERVAAETAANSEARKVIANPGYDATKAFDPTKIEYKAKSGNVGIMATPGDFSKLSDLQLQNRMRGVKKGGLFQTVKDEDQSYEYKAYQQELQRRSLAKQEKQKAPETKRPQATRPSAFNPGNFGGNFVELGQE